MADYPVRTPGELLDACTAVRGGDTIELHGGRYGGDARLSGCRGRRDAPIVIRAADEAWISGGTSADAHWGGDDPAQRPPRKPVVGDFAFLTITDCAHVRIESLKIRNYWPCIILIVNSTHIVVRNCRLEGGTYAIFAKGNETSHLLIEDNHWQQDTSDGHDLWRTIDWVEAHGAEGGGGTFRYFNGGFLAGKGIAGAIVVRRNRITDAYNGIRIKSGNGQPPSSEVGRRNAHVHIYDNDFLRVRDNPIEPEVCAWDWHVRHNRLVDCHSWFSVDGVGGGYWYFYGNTGRFTSRQGLPEHGRHTMGRVLKLSYTETGGDGAREHVPGAPWYVFNNSWHLRCPLVGGSNYDNGEGPDFTSFLDFVNNAFSWCDPGADGDWVCATIEMLHNLDFGRTAHTMFDFSLTNRQNYFDCLRKAGRTEYSGKLVSGAVFRSAQDGDFTLASGSPGRGNAWTLGIATAEGSEVASRLNGDGALHRGAMQEYGPTSVPDLEARGDAIIAEILYQDAMA